MESTTSTAGVDLSSRRAYPGLALALAILSVPGSTVAWDALPGGGFVFGLPPAIAAIYLGLQARRSADEGRGKALAAVVIAGAMVLMMVAWVVVESL